MPEMAKPKKPKITEEEWLAAEEPALMLRFLQAHGKASVRKLRLFAVECCRHVWHVFEDQRSRVAVEVAERYADGLANLEELAAAQAAVIQRRFGYMSRPENLLVGEAYLVPDRLAELAIAVAQEAVGLFATYLWYHPQEPDCRDAFLSGQKQAPFEQAVIVRDIFGNPFQLPASFDPALRTPKVVRLAQEIYDTRSFDRLPVLADALAEAGCNDADLLGHLRGSGPHVCGCWALDVILSKE
jgi:hypothetical protein